MATGGVLGAVSVVLGFDGTQFEAGAKRAQAVMGRFGSVVGTAATVAGAAITAFAVGTAMSLRSYQGEIDKLSKMSQKIGIPTEELSRLKHVAELSDVSLEQLATGIKKFSKEMSEMATATTGTGARALRTMGISIKDANGNLKATDVLLGEVADKFASYEDGAHKTALAMAVFGKSGADLIPMLNGGSKAMREAKKEAEDLGIVISTQLGKDTEHFNDNLTRLMRLKDAWLNKINEMVLPGLIALTDKMVASGKEAKGFSDTVVALGIGAKVVGSIALAVAAVFQGLASSVVNLTRAIGAFFSGEWKKAGEHAAAALVNPLNMVTADLFAQLDALWEKNGKAANGWGATVSEAAKKPAPALAAAVDKVKEFTRGLQEKSAAMLLEQQLIGQGIAAQTRANEMQALENMLKKENIKLSPERRLAVMAEIDALARQAEATDAAKAAYDRFYENVSVFQSALSSSFDKVLEGTFKVKDALKDLLKSLLKLWANQAFTGLFGTASKPGSLNLGSMFGFGGGKAGGGDVAAGQAYMVGEAGRELFVPNVPGQIVSNSQLASMKPASGGGITNVINAQGADPAGLARVERALADLNRNYEKRWAGAYRNQQLRGLRPS